MIIIGIEVQPTWYDQET